MGLEIERKFLVAGDQWRAAADAGSVFKQGYLQSEPGRTVRVRLAGDRAWLTIKGASRGAARAEYEYPIPPADAIELLDLCTPTVIDKTRYRVEYEGHVWEVDVFAGDNAGLVTAEVELAAEGEEVVLPEWLGDEVTDDHRYKNSQLSQRPYASW